MTKKPSRPTDSYLEGLSTLGGCVMAPLSLIIAISVMGVLLAANTGHPLLMAPIISLFTNLAGFYGFLLAVGLFVSAAKGKRAVVGYLVLGLPILLVMYVLK